VSEAIRKYLFSLKEIPPNPTPVDKKARKFITHLEETISDDGRYFSCG
jgi:hypothetical protein